MSDVISSGEISSVKGNYDWEVVYENLKEKTLTWVSNVV